jgi:tetratricopeptide (TPR) repeat protein
VTSGEVQPSGSDIDRARALMAMNRPEQALALLGRAAASRPGDPVPLCLQSACLLTLGRHDEALTAAETAIVAAPGSSWGYRNRALALSRLLRAAEAVDAATEAVRLAPYSAVELRVLAECQVKNRQNEAAMRSADRARQMEPDNAASWVTLSFVAVRSRKFREADRTARAALQIDPVNYAALNNLGVAYRNRWRFIKALQCFVRSWRLHPHESIARRNIVGLLTSLIILTLFGTVQLARFIGFGALLLPVAVIAVAAKGLQGLPAPALRVVGRDMMRAPGMRLGVIARAALVVTSPIWFVLALVVDIDIISRLTHGSAPIAEVLVAAALTALLVLAIRSIRGGAWKAFRRSS